MPRKLQLSSAKITRISGPYLSDACQLEIESGYERKLVGSFQRGLFLVYGRNVGPVSHYILATEDATNYLSELKKGSEILSADTGGRIKKSIVKENRIERTHSTLITALCDDIAGSELQSSFYNPKGVSLFIQDSDESSLVRKNGGSVSIRDLKLKTEILVYCGLQGYGRHFGTGVKNIHLIEK